MMKNTDDLIHFIREEIGEFNLMISLDTTLEEDLGVTGEEGIELMTKYSEKFKVDISGVDFSKYFYPEPSVFSGTYMQEILPLTIGDLNAGIVSGRLSK